MAACCTPFEATDCKLQVRYAGSERKFVHRVLHYLGYGLAHPIALEAALRLTEIIYGHCEGMFSSEFKHGPLSSILLTLPARLVTYHLSLARRSAPEFSRNLNKTLRGLGWNGNAGPHSPSSSWLPGLAAATGASSRSTPSAPTAN